MAEIDFSTLLTAAKALRYDPTAWHPAVALKLAELLDREARRIGSHAITTREVRDDWFAYECRSCGIGGSTSRAGLAEWQAQHARIRLVADDGLLALARTYLVTAGAGPEENPNPEVDHG